MWAEKEKRILLLLVKEESRGNLRFVSAVTRKIPATVSGIELKLKTWRAKGDRDGASEEQDGGHERPVWCPLSPAPSETCFYSVLDTRGLGLWSLKQNLI